MSPKLRLIGPEGTQIGIVSKWEALQKARDYELDLVEVAPKANPPVARIIDFKKFRYQEARKEREAKKAAHEQEVKEIRLRPFTAQGDLEVKIKKAKDFINQGDRVKFTIVFRGREITKKEFGFAIINKINASLSDIAKIEKPTKIEGKQLITIFGPLK